MLIRTMNQIEAQGRVVPIAEGRASAVRLLTRSDGVGFSVSEARASAIGHSDLWYKHHWEANYIRSGSATLEDRTRGERWPLEPGVLYCVGPRDRHRIIRSEVSDMRIISVFNPPIEGDETHDADGAYPPTGDVPEGQGHMFVKTPESIRAAGMDVDLGNNVLSRRYITAADGLGFSLHSVHLPAGVELDLRYKHHWEANLLLDGTLRVTHRDTQASHELEAGGLYLVGPADPHHLEALTDVHLISVFNPPLQGTETHDEDGAYPASGPVPSGPR